MAREIIVSTRIADLCTDEIDLKFISDAHDVLGTTGTQTLLDRANADFDNVNYDLERLIRHLDFYLGKAESKLQASGYEVEWDDEQYVIYREIA